MRAGDDEHRHHALHDECGVGRVEQPPRRQREEGGTQGDVEQPGRGPVGEHLHRGLGGLGVGDELHDAGEGGVRSGLGDLDGQGAGPVDAAGHDAVFRLLGDVNRLAGEQGLVDVGFPFDDDTVDGDRAAGAHQHEVADLEVGDGMGHDMVAVHHLGLVGDELGQLAERVLRAHDRGHLDPVAEQHDRDEGGELPPEVHAGEAEKDCDRVAEGDDDRERDERHHAGLLRAQLCPGALEEHQAPVEEQRRAEGGGDELAVREARPGEAEDVLQAGGENERRDGQRETDPELALELRGVVGAVVVMTRVGVVTVLVVSHLVLHVVVVAVVHGHSLLPIS